MKASRKGEPTPTGQLHRYQRKAAAVLLAYLNRYHPGEKAELKHQLWLFTR